MNRKQNEPKPQEPNETERNDWGFAENRFAVLSVGTLFYRLLCLDVFDLSSFLCYVDVMSCCFALGAH